MTRPPPTKATKPAQKPESKPEADTEPTPVPVQAQHETTILDFVNQQSGQTAQTAAKQIEEVPQANHFDFDALAELAELAIQPGAQHPRDHATRPADGDAYVRMINLSGHTIAVSYRMVADRFLDGYKFIEGDPAIPISRTPQGRSQDAPDAAAGNPKYRPHARATASGRTHDDAMRIWFGEMRNDLRTMRHRTDLYWEFMRELGQTLAKLKPGGNQL